MTTTSTAFAAATTLLSEWETQPSSTKALLPTAQQLYQLGTILYALGVHNDRRPSSDGIASNDVIRLQDAVRVLWTAMPQGPQLLADLHQALLELLQQDDTRNRGTEEIQAALQSLIGLYRCFIRSSSRTEEDGEGADDDIAIKSLPSLTLDHVEALLLLYQKSLDKHLKSLIVQFLSLRLWTMPFEELLPALQQLLEEPAILWTDLLEHERQENPEEWSENILKRYTDPTQRDYLSSLLVADNNTAKPATGVSKSLRPQASAFVPKETVISPPVDEMQRRIDQVRQVLPDLGEGFCETALSLFGADVERTVQTLLDDPSNWPEALVLLDRSLPRRYKADRTAALEEEQAKAATKASLQAIQQRQEQEAAAIDQVLLQEQHDEYDDDFDDQYERDGIGGMDHGLYDDYEAVLTYNRAVQSVQEEASFWQENRNLNREIAKSGTSQKSDSKAYRGPDKTRGGRIPNAGRGPGRGRGRPGRGRGDAKADTKLENKGSGDDDDKTKQRPSQRSKARKMANRREKQKQAAMKKSG